MKENYQKHTWSVDNKITNFNLVGKILHYIMLFIGIPLATISLICFISNPFGYVFAHIHSVSVFSMLALYFFFYYSNHEKPYIRFTIAIFEMVFTYLAYDTWWNILYCLEDPQRLLYTISFFSIFVAMVYIFYFINKQFSFAKINFKWIIVWASILSVCLVSLYHTGFFAQQYLFANNLGPDPHNMLWLLGKLWSFTLLLPGSKILNKTSQQ